MLLFIVGFPGAGKSGIGREAARRAGVRFIDTDRVIEELHGSSVSKIFEEKGEEYFRLKEREVLEGIEDPAIVATGGGLPCEGDAMEYMNHVGRTVYLRFSPSGLLPRLRRGVDKRPKLAGLGEGLAAYIEETLTLREPFYARATMIIDCDSLSDEAVIEYVARHSMGYKGG